MSKFLNKWLKRSPTSPYDRTGLAEVEDRLNLAVITAEVARQISGRRSLQDVLDSTVELIQTRYPNIYHVQIFLIDKAGHEAKLVASTGEVGRLLLERKHSLEIGSASIVGQAALRGEPIVGRAGSRGSLHKPNPLLPDTAVEAAFPLRLGERVIGVMDLQSRFIDAFQTRDEPIFQSLADHIAIAIDNAQLFEINEQQLEENQELVKQMREALSEIQQLNQQLTGRAWSEYIRQRGHTFSLNVDMQTGDAHSSDEVTPTLSDALRDNKIVEQKENGSRIIAVPLRVRGQVIGAMEFELDEHGRIAPEDLEFIQEVGERFGFAVENNRLYEESQRVAQREALVNQIGTRLQTTTNVEATLVEAARSLHEVLGVNHVAIRLGDPPDEMQQSSIEGES